MLRGRYVDAAIALIRDHASRTVTGPLTDPAEVAAVVAVERLAERIGSTDAALLRAVVDETTGGWSVGDGPAEPGERDILLRDLVEVVANALLQGDAQRRPDASALNVEGGAHPVALDAVVLRAATRASSRSFEQLPYYRARYGSRGARFATSDSGWLASLVAHRPETAGRHVAWLASLLAVRGMPTWLMELHLDELVAQLREAGCPVGGLPTVLGRRRWERRLHVPDALFEQAEFWMRDRLAVPPVEGSGRLIAAATSDVLAGVTTDDSAVLDWMTDPDRTSREDAAALLSVRARVRSAAGVD